MKYSDVLLLYSKNFPSKLQNLTKPTEALSVVLKTIALTTFSLRLPTLSLIKEIEVKITRQSVVNNFSFTMFKKMSNTNGAMWNVTFFPDPVG